MQDGVILQITAATRILFVFSLVFKFGNPDTLNNNSPNLHKKAKTMKDSGRSSKMMSSCKWSISNTFDIYSQHYLVA